MLSKTRIYGFDYAINPYIGCTHGCVYCYARFMCKYVKGNKKWGTFCIPKNTLKLKQELKVAENGNIIISSVTDPYQEIEMKEEITRDILEKLVKFNFKVSILTKSSLVLRDIDIIRKLNAEVGLTICLNEEHRIHFEKNAQSVEERVKALKKLKENNITTYLFLGPIIPFLTDINSILSKTCKYVDYIVADKLRIKYGNWEDIKHVLKTHYNEYYRPISSILFSTSKYYESIRKQIIEICNKIKKHVWFCF